MFLLFTCFLILATITDFIYLTAAIVDEEFLSKTEVVWEAMWAFAYLRSCLIILVLQTYSYIKRKLREFDDRRLCSKISKQYFGQRER